VRASPFDPSFFALWFRSWAFRAGLLWGIFPPLQGASLLRADGVFTMLFRPVQKRRIFASQAPLPLLDTFQYFSPV